MVVGFAAFVRHASATPKILKTTIKDLASQVIHRFSVHVG